VLIERKAVIPFCYSIRGGAVVHKHQLEKVQCQIKNQTRNSLPVTTYWTLSV